MSKTNNENLWNRMIRLINNHKDEEVKKKARMLLGQYNTAGGNMIKYELISILEEHGY